MTSKSIVDDGALRTRAYLLWEADGRPFGRDDHYWGLALAEATAPTPASKPKRAAATSAVASKTAKPKAAAKPLKAKARAPVAKGRKK